MPRAMLTKKRTPKHWRAKISKPNLTHAGNGFTALHRQSEQDGPVGLDRIMGGQSSPPVDYTAGNAVSVSPTIAVVAEKPTKPAALPSVDVPEQPVHVLPGGPSGATKKKDEKSASIFPWILICAVAFLAYSGVKK